MDPSAPQDNNNEQDKVRYEALLASIGEGLIITNNSGEITAFNKAAESILGWTRQEALGKLLQDVVKMEYHNGRHASHTDNELNKITIAEPLYFVRRDGSKFPVSIRMTSYVQGEAVLGTITLFHDVTAEHNIDQMKTEFISLVSHQLKTPLAAVRWYSEMLLSGDAGKLTEQQLKFADFIHSSIRRMNDLVNALLNISRIESGRIKVSPEPTDLKKMVEDIVAEIKIRPDAKKRNIILNLQNDIPQINIDSLLVRQVYTNLITNAVKYTPEGGEITVNVSRKDPDVLSTVSDTGFGIPEKEKPRVFERFWRGENVVMKEISGNGLGLYLTKSVVELSGGKIWYESTEGKGTAFYFTLPLSGSPSKEGVVTLDS
jgi:PAS domain S-box-containing protein